VVNLKEIRTAGANLEGIIHKTSLDFSTTFTNMTGVQTYLKTENLQKTGSFKIRGAYNKISSLTSLEKKRGVIAASAGNHAQGVAFAAIRAGIKSTIVMPEGTPISKALATKNYGAEIILHGQVYDDAFQKAKEIQALTGAAFVHAFDDPAIIAGQGTVGLEILEQLPDVGVILVPIGGGGLASGIAIAVKESNPGIKVIGVEAAGAACYLHSKKAGKICPLPTASTIADGIAVKSPGGLTYSILQKYLDDVVTVDDEEIATTILLLLERAKLIVEGAGAVSLAALLYHQPALAASNQKVAAVLSGANIDVNFISLIIEKGLVKTGRHIRLVTIMADKPGNLQSFLSVIAQERGNIISINHERAQAHLPIDKAKVEAVVETQGAEHAQRIMQVLQDNGFSLEDTDFKPHR
jgi:threonine dehydratase